MLSTKTPRKTPDWTDRTLRDDAETLARFDKVCELVEGFESPFGLELLATVHWVVEQEKAKDSDDVIAQTYAWNDRKKGFSRRQIHIALQALAKGGWLPDFTPGATV